jgi:hypothetical protein
MLRCSFRALYRKVMWQESSIEKEKNWLPLHLCERCCTASGSGSIPAPPCLRAGKAAQDGDIRGFCPVRFWVQQSLSNRGRATGQTSPMLCKFF